MAGEPPAPQRVLTAAHRLRRSAAAPGSAPLGDAGMGGGAGSRAAPPGGGAGPAPARADAGSGGGPWGPGGAPPRPLSSLLLSRRQALGSEYRVRLGALRLGQAPPRALSVPVRRVLLHPDFSEDGARGDLALLQLRRPVPLSSRGQPVCLPEPGARPPPGAPCWVTGWGSLLPGGEAEGGARGSGGGGPGTPSSSFP